MRNKWHRFNSQYSPVVAATVDKGASNVKMDWFRVANEDAAINGVPVKKYRDKYNQFATDEDVKQFFKTEILCNMKDNIDKDQVAEYLMTAFHQGGLMYPVSASMSNMLFNEAGLQPFASGSSRQLSITTTENGFKIQEIYTSKQFLIANEEKAGAGLSGRADPDTGLILPDAGKDFVIKAGASVDVDFSAKASEPAITVESNYISYGNAGVQSALDKRNIGQVIVDFFRNIFGLNSVKDVSVEKEQTNTEQKSSSVNLEQDIVKDVPVEKEQTTTEQNSSSADIEDDLVEESGMKPG